jgi:hypothetical protein
MDCERKAAQDPWFHEQLDADGEAHGEEHQHIGDLGWCTPSARCYLAQYDELADAAEDVATEPGRYPVHHTFEDYNVVVLELAQ